MGLPPGGLQNLNIADIFVNSKVLNCRSQAGFNTLLNNFMELLIMAANTLTGDGHRNEAVRNGSQTDNPKTGH